MAYAATAGAMNAALRRARRAGAAARAGVAGRRVRRHRLHRAEPLRDRHAAGRRWSSSPPGLRLRLVFMPLLLLLFLLNVGYTISAVAAAGPARGVANWIATSWYMAVTVDLLRHGGVRGHGGAARHAPAAACVVGAMIASLLAIAGYFNLVPGGRDLLTLYDRARGTFKDPNVLGAFLILPALFVPAERGLRPARQVAPQRHRLRHHGARHPAGVSPAPPGAAWS